MVINWGSRLEDNSAAELAEAFLQSHVESNGMEFVSDNQLRRLYNVVMEEMNQREISLIPE